MTSAFEREYAAAARQYSNIESNSAEKLLTDSKPARVSKSNTEIMAAEASAFGNGFLHSFESSYNGVTQLLAGDKYKPVSIADKSASNETIGYMAGEAVGAGIQVVALSKILPRSTSIVGSVANRGAAGALYGGLLVPSEGNDLATERFKSGASMAAFMTAYDATRIGAYGMVGPAPLGIRVGIGGLAGGVGAGSQLWTESTLGGKEFSQEQIGKTVVKGVMMGAAMEFTSAAIAGTDVANMGRVGYEGARGARPQRSALDLNAPLDAATREHLARIKQSSSLPEGVATDSAIAARLDPGISPRPKLGPDGLRAATAAGIPRPVTH